MNLRDLEYVEALGRYKNFSHAASTCNVSQPALSNQIKKLEQELGAPLFDRGPYEIRPTELGLRVIEAAKVILDQAQKIKDIAIEYRDPEALPYKIGMTPTLAPYLTQYFGNMFRVIYPTMSVALIEDIPVNLVQMVEDRDLDIALIARKSHHTKLSFTSIFSEPLFLAVRRGHPLTRLERITPDEVPAENIIRLRVPFGFEIEEELPESPTDLRQKIGFDLTAARFETACRHVSNSDDCTIVPSLAAEQFKRDNWGLSFIKFEGHGNLRDVGVISRPACPRTPIMMAIGKHINRKPPLGVIPTFDENFK